MNRLSFKQRIDDGEGTSIFYSADLTEAGQGEQICDLAFCDSRRAYKFDVKYAAPIFRCLNCIVDDPDTFAFIGEG